MIYLYTILIYQPIFNALVWFYNVIPTHDIGLAIIAITILVRAILYPLMAHSLKSQKSMQAIQPKIKEIQLRFKNDKEGQAKEMMKLYKEEKVSPFSSCLPLLIQLPILIAVYHVFQKGINSTGFDLLYPFVSHPGTINHISLGFLDVTKSSPYLAVLAAIAQYWQTKMMLVKKPPQPTGKVLEGAKDEDMMAQVNKQMVYTMPLLTLFISWSLPAGLAMYWLLTTLITGLQQLIILRPKKEKAVEYITPEIKA